MSSENIIILQYRDIVTLIDLKENDAPDIETLQGSLSDMLSMKLSSQLTDILETCSEGKTESSESTNVRG